MSENTANKQTTDTTSVFKKVIRKGGTAKTLIKAAVGILLFGLFLFLPARTLRWPMGWAFLAMVFINQCFNFLVIARKYPDLVAERSGIGEGAKKWDVPLASLMGVWLPISTLFVAGLDKRFQWTETLPLWQSIASLGVSVLGIATANWAMASNKFFAPVVRIQKERGHIVADRGPYRIVRHPGYVGVMLLYCSLPLVLSSLWAFIPAGIILIITFVRTALEDRTLQHELEGYTDYAQRVRYRLIPGIW